MSNSRTRTLNYKPRYTQMEAYDLLPVEIRDALKEGPQEWDTGHILRQFRKLREVVNHRQACRQLVRAIRGWHSKEIKDGKPWRDRKPGQRWADIPLSPHVLAEATMQHSNLPTSFPGRG